MTVALKSIGSARKVRSQKPADIGSSSAKVTPLSRPRLTTVKARLDVPDSGVRVVRAVTVAARLNRSGLPQGDRDVVQIPSGESTLSAVGSVRPQAKPAQISPNPWVIPLWLRSLMGANQAAGAVTFLLVLTSLVIYGAIVYSQQQWGKEYRKLETLRRDERQLTAANEALKNQIAEGAEAPKTGFVPPDPSRAIFLERKPQQTAPRVEPVTPPKPSVEADSKPLGY